MNTKSREERLLEAEEKANTAKKLLDKLAGWEGEVKFFLGDRVPKRKKSKQIQLVNLFNLLKSDTHLPKTLKTTFFLEDKRKQQREQKNQEELKNKENEEYLKEEAVLFLEKKGYRLGKDFSLIHAIEIATNIAFLEDRNYSFKSSPHVSEPETSYLPQECEFIF